MTGELQAWAVGSRIYKMQGVRESMRCGQCDSLMIQFMMFQFLYCYQQLDILCSLSPKMICKEMFHITSYCYFVAQFKQLLSVCFEECINHNDLIAKLFCASALQNKNMVIFVFCLLRWKHILFIFKCSSYIHSENCQVYVCNGF